MSWILLLAAAVVAASPMWDPDLGPRDGGTGNIDAMFGFRDVKYGMNISDRAFAGAVYIDDALELRNYRRPNDMMTLAGIKLTAITYGFSAKRLVRITIATAGELNCRRMGDAAVASFGEGINNTREFKSWFGKRAWADYFYNGDNNDPSTAAITLHLLEESGDSKSVPGKFYDKYWNSGMLAVVIGVVLGLLFLRLNRKKVLGEPD